MNRCTSDPAFLDDTVALEKLKRYLPAWIAGGGAGDPSLSAEDKLILFLNHPGLTATELDAVRYIGPAQAEAILAHLQRERIDSVEELQGAVHLETWHLESLVTAAGDWCASIAGASVG